MFEIVALTADTDSAGLARQAAKYRPKVVCLAGDKAGVKGFPSGTKVLRGIEGLSEIVRRQDVDIVMFAISGAMCLVPLVEAIKARKAIALANKEALVSAGDLVMGLARRSGVRIIPVDSEHSAIFQCVDNTRSRISKIFLTGSGGPLLDVDRSRFDKLSRSFVLKHPRWKMGKKISVDSATMMNKGLEIIEARCLFNVAQEEIEVLVHPEAMIHSMVEFADNSVLAQLAVPDMRGPIQYALTYPSRIKGMTAKVDLAKLGNLTFRKPDAAKFPCLGLARSAAADGGTAPAVLCAADEEAVRCYLDGRIKLTGIAKTIEKVLSKHRNITGRELVVYDVLESDRWAREEAKKICSR
jgi:1-deoxy-D-xylulose-5-phosphate reductoisomerase